MSASTPQLPQAIETSPSETLLFERFIGGDDAALLELFALLNPRLHTFAARLLRSTSAADDITQHLWERLIGMRGTTPKVGNIGGYLMRTARNACLNTIKRERRIVPWDAIAHAAYLGDDDEISDRAEFVHLAMERLSFDDRELLVLQIDCGYSLEEIAAMKGSTPEAMWKRASRARKRLRALVSQQLEVREASRNEPRGGGHR